jgi:hypothetical protein
MDGLEQTADFDVLGGRPTSSESGGLGGALALLGKSMAETRQHSALSFKAVPTS